VNTAVNRIEEMTVDIQPGGRIENAIAEAIVLAKANRCVVRFEFNGRPISVDSCSNPDSIAKGWWEIGELAMKLHGACVQPTGEVKWGSDGR
jgi:hypothetical protein